MGKKGPVHFLAKKSRIILEIYVNQVFQLLALSFYKQYIRRIGDMIYMDNSAIYHMLKYTKKYCYEVEFLYIIWSA